MGGSGFDWSVREPWPARSRPGGAVPLSSDTGSRRGSRSHPALPAPPLLSQAKPAPLEKLLTKRNLYGPRCGCAGVTTVLYLIISQGHIHPVRFSKRQFELSKKANTAEKQSFKENPWHETQTSHNVTPATFSSLFLTTLWSTVLPVSFFCSPVFSPAFIDYSGCRVFGKVGLVVSSAGWSY